MHTCITCLLTDLLFWTVIEHVNPILNVAINLLRINERCVSVVPEGRYLLKQERSCIYNDLTSLAGLLIDSRIVAFQIEAHCCCHSVLLDATVLVLLLRVPD